MSFLQTIFSGEGFMPHGHCYLWDEKVVWLHVVSDAIIALAYFSIPLSLVKFIKARKDLDFFSIYVWSAVFIVSCGLSHLCAIITVWVPIYWIEGAVKALTAVSSAVTAVLLLRLVPTLISLPSPRDLHVANQNLQLANKELEAFSYSVSHDLRAPLRAIDGFSKLLVTRAATNLDADSKRMLGLVRSETERMAKLIEDLLLFSRVIRKPMHWDEVDMERLAREAYEEFLALEPGRKVDFKLDGLPKVKGEEGMLRQVWANLISNAIKFTRPREVAEVKVSSRVENGETIYSVSDNGVGFNMEYAEKLFGVFQRFHTQKEFEGTGVGLALAQRIIQRHGGRIWAKTEVDKGTTFFFTLPKDGSAL